MTTTLIATPSMTYSETVAHFANIIMQASVRDIELASRWYHEAFMVALEVADNMSVPLENAAAIVSAFSPRNLWSVNVRQALAFSRNETVKGLPNNLRMAVAAADHGFDALRGPKTNAFARAIAGDDSAVVVDVWMCRAANIGTDSPNKTQYAFISDAVIDAAALFGMTPRTAQALIWLIIRGSAD
jgi:hypothetical protein